MASDPSGGRAVTAAQLNVRQHLLTVGLPSGTLVVRAPDGRDTADADLAAAFRVEPWQPGEHTIPETTPEPEPDGAEPLAGAVTVTDEVERAADIARRIIGGELFEDEFVLAESGRLIGIA